MAELSFHGAARQVTGSCFLIEHRGRRVLVDCGLYQGGRELEEDNAGPFGFEPAEVDYLLLTHAHLDHSGRIPLLAKRGFRGEIITTAAAREFTRLVLLDSAGIQEEDAARRQRKARRQNHEEPKPLYTTEDAVHAMEYFGRTARYGEGLDLGDGIHVTFHDAGHILGSSFLAIRLDEGESSRTLVFSGDLGNPGRPFLPDPAPPPEADYVITETTYGDRNHRSIDDSVEELFDAVNTIIGRGGNVIIPTFALERSQEILYLLKRGVTTGRLPRRLPVYLDSPMAISATEIYRRHLDLVDPKWQQGLSDDDPFDMPGLQFVREASESRKLNGVHGGAVIMAGSGMCTGGRVRHHLRHNIWREEAGIVFVGFAAHGTPARRIVDGADHVPLLGDDIAVHAGIWTINGFSGHADQSMLLDWLGRAGKPRKIFLVHGEPDRGMDALAEALTGRGDNVARPQLHERVTLD